MSEIAEIQLRRSKTTKLLLSPVDRRAHLPRHMLRSTVENVLQRRINLSILSIIFKNYNILSNV